VRVTGLPLSVEAYRVVQLAGAALAAGLVLLLRWTGADGKPLLRAALGLACCWMTLLGPATESSTYIVLAPALGWALTDAWTAPRSAAVRGLTAAAYGLFAAARLASLFPWAAHAHALGPHPLGALLLFAALVITAAQDARPRAPVVWPTHEWVAARAA
jgi:hypothetical protein